MNTNELCLRKITLCNTKEATLTTQLQQHLQRWNARLQHWHMNWRTRRQLYQLSGYQLKDIGVSFGKAQQEASKPFWKD